MVSWLTWSGFEPCGQCIVFLSKALLSNCLSTLAYKWVPANLMLEVALRWTIIPSRGSYADLTYLCHATRNCNKQLQDDLSERMKKPGPSCLDTVFSGQYLAF